MTGGESTSLELWKVGIDFQIISKFYTFLSISVSKIKSQKDNSNIFKRKEQKLIQWKDDHEIENLNFELNWKFLFVQWENEWGESTVVGMLAESSGGVVWF